MKPLMPNCDASAPPAVHVGEDRRDLADRLVESIEQIYRIADRSEGWEVVVTNLLEVMDRRGGAMLGNGSGEVRSDDSDALDNARLLRWLMPHLERVLRQQAERDQRDEVEAFQALLLDRHPFGLALVRVNGDLLWANEAMKACLGEVDPMALRRLVDINTPRPAKLTVTTGADPHRATRHWAALDLPHLGPTCVAVLASTDSPIELNPALLRDLYRLTPAEAGVAQGLAEGLSADALAARHGTSLETVRTQIKAVLSKLQVHRQGEAVAKLLSAPTWLDVHPVNAAAPTPLSPRGRVIQVRGQPVGVAMFGPSDGRPVFFMHSWGGSRLQAPPDEDVLFRHGVLLIVPERPGHGLSYGHALDATPRGFAPIVAAVADKLKIARFDVLGYSLGTVFALACAKTLGERVDGVHLVAPVAPLSSMKDLRGMLPSGRLMLALAMKVPKVAGSLVRLWIGQLRRKPSLYLESVLPHLPPLDAAIMRSPELHEHYTRSFVQAIHQGDDALVRELQLMASDWSDLLAVSQPIAMWHGDSDSHAPLHLAQSLAAAWPQSKLTVVPQAGHYLLYHHWHTIVEAMAKRNNSRPAPMPSASTPSGG
jgi:pimeloyl-ACP methyl ester carboxylesterase/DNA-binding CsgD family transcriptional regulator